MIFAGIFIGTILGSLLGITCMCLAQAAGMWSRAEEKELKKKNKQNKE